MSSGTQPSTAPVAPANTGQPTSSSGTGGGTAIPVSMNQPIATLLQPAQQPSATVGTGATVITAAMLTVMNARKAKIADLAAKFEEVSEAIIAPPTNTSSARVTETGTTDIFVVPILPDTATALQRKIWALYLASGLKSIKTYADREMAVQIIAFFHVLYPTLVERTRTIEWTPIILTLDQLKMLDVFLSAGRRFPARGKGQDATKAALENLRANVIIPNTLGIKSVTLDFFLTDMDWLMFHGYAGLLLFTMHKLTTTASNNALMTARPLALRKKYSRENDTYALWSESGRPSQTAYASCTVIWKLIPATRYVLMHEFAHSSVGQITAEREALFTTVRLMQWTDLSHIPIINEALTNFDMLRACPLIQGDIAAYQAGIIQLVEMMPIARDANRNIIYDSRGKPARDLTTMSYVKALWGDRKTLAQRGTMPVLLGVALELLKPTRSSLRTYTGPAGYTDRISSVRDWYDAALDVTRAL